MSLEACWLLGWEIAAMVPRAPPNCCHFFPFKGSGFLDASVAHFTQKCFGKEESPDFTTLSFVCMCAHINAEREDWEVTFSDSRTLHLYFLSALCFIAAPWMMANRSSDTNMSIRKVVFVTRRGPGL